MTVAGKRPIVLSSSAWLSHGFRPFFLAAGLWALLALALWIDLWWTGQALPSRFDPLDWHIHEMLFGFVMAAVAGFLLTAVPNWTGGLPVRGRPLAVLVGLWLLGRIACLISALGPAGLAMAADMMFPLVLVATIGREILARRQWRSLPMVAPVAILGLANLLMHLESVGFAVPPGLGWRLGLAATAVLISVVAGRIVPSFTRNWLSKVPKAPLPASHNWIDTAAVGTGISGLFGWAFFPNVPVSGSLLLFAAGFNLWRLVRWNGWATVEEPLLAILHLGYAWLVVGLGLLGLVTLGLPIPESAAIHALTVGAIGTMTLAVMTRATRGHTGRSLMADRATMALYLLITLAAVTRVAATISDLWTAPLIMTSAGLWLLAFAVFVLSYGPKLVRPSLTDTRSVP